MTVDEAKVIKAKIGFLNIRRSKSTPVNPTFAEFNWPFEWKKKEERKKKERRWEFHHPLAKGHLIYRDI